MTYRPAMTDITIRSPLTDRYLNFCLVMAPATRVEGVVGGILRARNNGAIVTEKDATPASELATTDDGYFCLRRRAVVAAPMIGAGALVDYTYVFDLPRALAVMLPDAEILAFQSNFESAKEWQNRFRVFRDGSLKRLVVLDKGMTVAGLTFEEVGSPEPCEDTDRYRLSVVSERLSRKALIETAERAGVDVEGSLWGRQFKTVVRLDGVEDLMSDPGWVHQRTDRYGAEMARAIELGIGDGETSVDRAMDNAKYLSDVEEATQFYWRFGRALERAGKDPARRKKAYEKWMNAKDRPAMFVPQGDSLTAGLDPDGDAVALGFLHAEAQLWKDIQTSYLRRVQFIVDDIPEGLYIPAMDAVQATAFQAMKAGEAPNADCAVLHAIRDALVPFGLHVDMDRPMPTEEEGVLEALWFIQSDAGDFAASLNNDITTELTVRPPIVIGD